MLITGSLVEKVNGSGERCVLSPRSVTSELPTLLSRCYYHGALYQKLLGICNNRMYLKSEESIKDINNFSNTPYEFFKNSF